MPNIWQWVGKGFFGKVEYEIHPSQWLMFKLTVMIWNLWKKLSYTDEMFSNLDIWKSNQMFSQFGNEVFLKKMAKLQNLWSDSIFKNFYFYPQSGLCTIISIISLVIRYSIEKSHFIYYLFKKSKLVTLTVTELSKWSFY